MKAGTAPLNTQDGGASAGEVKEVSGARGSRSWTFCDDNRVSGHDQDNMLRTKEASEAASDEDLLVKASGQGGRRRVVVRHGEARPRKAMDFMAELSPKVQTVTSTVLFCLELMSMSK